MRMRLRRGEEGRAGSSVCPGWTNKKENPDFPKFEGAAKMSWLLLQMMTMVLWRESGLGSLFWDGGCFACVCFKLVLFAGGGGTPVDMSEREIKLCARKNSLQCF